MSVGRICVREVDVAQSNEIVTADARPRCGNAGSRRRSSCAHRNCHRPRPGCPYRRGGSGCGPDHRWRSYDRASARPSRRHADRGSTTRDAGWNVSSTPGGGSHRHAGGPDQHRRYPESVYRRFVIDRRVIIRLTGSICGRRRKVTLPANRSNGTAWLTAVCRYAPHLSIFFWHNFARSAQHLKG